MREQNETTSKHLSVAELQNVIAAFPADMDKVSKEEAIDIVKRNIEFLKILPDTPEVREKLSNLPKNPDRLSESIALATAKDTIEFVRSLSATVFVASGNDPVTGLAAATDFVSELNNIDFAKLIGGPLQAAVKAQADASMTTVNFIKEVGFAKPASEDDSSPRELMYVNFFYNKKVPKKDAEGKPLMENGVQAYDDSPTEVKVPLLAMLNIPSLRIEEVNIDFNVKLNSLQTANTSTDSKLNLEVGANFSKINFKVTASTQRASSSGMEVKKEYTMGVKVRATQDEIPAGLEKILNLLSD